MYIDEKTGKLREATKKEHREEQTRRRNAGYTTAAFRLPIPLDDDLKLYAEANLMSKSHLIKAILKFWRAEIGRTGKWPPVALDPSKKDRRVTVGTGFTSTGQIYRERLVVHVDQRAKIGDTYDERTTGKLSTIYDTAETLEAIEKEEKEWRTSRHTSQQEP